MVFDGEIRQVCRILFAFTRPYLGTARSMSKTLAVSRYSGGFRRRVWIDTRPAFRSRLSWARRVRISFARCSASMRWRGAVSGAAAGFVAEWVPGGIERRVYIFDPAPQAETPEFASTSTSA